MVIIIDTREQSPWKFDQFKDVDIITRKLDDGDYSLDGHETEIAIERKTAADFLSSITQGRQRFEKEFERLSKKNFKFIIIEDTLHAIFTKTTLEKRMKPASITGTVASWTMKYGVNFFFMASRKSAELMAYSIFKNYLQNLEKGLI